ncbi:ATP-binding cassette domain-containing protein [Mangrovimonas futianensis]|uniref:ATP-binding cassette domain-containing protein n=1 Tax=Mangrovimonas futianensis TaxID=2895523 RepID=UPI001E513258|nr:ABC transporter ATP-binding protein [Mangrovimonas futianensis]MCF1421137.1 ABC transporter ATP-binding protein [Mangrovimonas futianensis]
MILEVDNVELSFNKKTILNSVYFKAEQGKITSLIGKNGSGKSCLLEIIFGSLQPKYKLIRINKKPFLKPLHLYKNKVGFLPQHQISPSRLKIKSIFKLFGVSLNQFMIDFESFNKYRNSRINELSSGEIRILETYVILKSPMDIILLDEPFSYLAPIAVIKLKELIKEEKEKKIIILTDHQYREVLDISDTCYFLSQGGTKLISSEKDLQNQNYIS